MRQSESVTYIALSYMWHPDKAQKNEGLHRVLLNGVPFSVTEKSMEIPQHCAEGVRGD